MFLCRLSLAWGIPPTEIETAVAAGDLDLMARYYAFEPWGTLRDNMHAGIVAANIRNVFRGENAKLVTFQDFMLVDAETNEKRVRESNLKQGQLLWAAFDSMAPPKGK